MRHKHAEAIIAWANGAEIEAKFAGIDDEWSVTKTPRWADAVEYRVRRDQARDLCQRCGKRNGPESQIHTCTPDSARTFDDYGHKIG